MNPESYRARIYRDYQGSLDPALRADDSPQAFASGRALYRRSFLPLLPADRKARILDIGCGRGTFLYYLQSEGYENACGVDRSPETVRRALERGIKHIVEADTLEYLRARPGAFDCIVAIDVFEHLLKPEVVEWLDAIYAALAPGGIVLIQAVNADGPGFGRMLYVDFTHETAFTRYSLHQVLGIAGFRDDEFHPMEPADGGWRKRLIWKAVRLMMGLIHHAEVGSGIWNNDHILTVNILAKARKPS